MEEGIESILIADCGTIYTKVILVDVVGERYRFVARGEALSTAGPPWSDVTLGVRQAIAEIERTTGRILFDNQKKQLIIPERANGQGVDAFVAATSSAHPLRVVLAGLAQDLSIASARQAALSSYSVVVDVLSLGDQADGAGSVDAKVERIYHHRPDVILLTGGTDGGATAPILDLAEIVALACSLWQEAPPRVIFAGNKAVRSRVAEIMGERANLQVVDNVRPAINLENLTGVQEEMERLYRELKMVEIPGLKELQDWSPVPILPTPQAFGYIVQYLASQWEEDRGVIGLDIGGSATSVVAMVGGHFYTLIRSDLGMGNSIGDMLEQVEMQDLLRWLPFEMDEAEARNILLNKKLHPMSVPQTREESLLEQAVAREILRLALKGLHSRWPSGPARPHPNLLPFFEPIIGCGGVLARVPHHGQAALVLLDSLEPVGVSTLVLDPISLAASLGVLATIQPLAAVQVLEQDAFVNLGTVVAPVGTAQEGELALRLKVTYQDGMSFEAEAAYGSLELIPLPAGRQATLEIETGRGFDIGPLGKGKGVLVNGGTLGIIIDARGRPLPLHAEPSERQRRVQEWLWDMGSDQTEE